MTEKRYAIIIASNKFQDKRLNFLKYAENDAANIKELLWSKDYGDFEEPIILKNQPNYEILQELERILENARKNDLVLIYYSGHGKQDRSGKLHLTTSNTNVDLLKSTSIPIESIKNYIESARSNKVILVLDCCYSGLAGAAFTKGTIDDQLQLLSRARGTYIMTSSTEIQLAFESDLDKMGVFTRHIIEGIRSWKAANEAGNITIDSLYSYVEREMLCEVNQTPMKWALSAVGDIIIASTKDKKSVTMEKMLMFIENINKYSCSKAPDPERFYPEITSQSGVKLQHEKREAILYVLKEKSLGENSGQYEIFKDEYIIDLDDMIQALLNLMSEGITKLNHVDCVYFKLQEQHDPYEPEDDYRKVNGERGFLNGDLRVENNKLNISNVIFIPKSRSMEGVHYQMYWDNGHYL